MKLLKFWRRTTPASTVKILADEYAQVHGMSPRRFDEVRGGIDRGVEHVAERPGRPRPGLTGYDRLLKIAERKLVRDFHERPTNALCLSGGGIRSAAFALGVIQYLAASGTLTKFHYLSTVSGGGYIGAWLSTWIAKAKNGYADVEKVLAWNRLEQSEPLEITHLRQNSRYLTQRAGLTSGDTWAAVAITIRNLILNWLLIVPLIAALILIPKLAISFATRVHDVLAPNLAIIALLLYIAVVLVLACNRPRWTFNNLDRGYYVRFYHAPLVASAILWVFAWTALDRPIIYAPALGFLYLAAWLWSVFDWTMRSKLPLVYVAVAEETQKTFGVLKYEIRLTKPSNTLVTVCAYTEDRQAVEGIHFKRETRELRFEPGNTSLPFWVNLKGPRQGEPVSIDGQPITARDLRVLLRNANGALIARLPGFVNILWDGVCMLARGLAVGLVLAAVQYGLFHVLPPDPFQTVIFGVPGALLAHLVGSIVFTALNNMSPRSESDREWQGRLDGFSIAFALAWMVWISTVTVLPSEIVALEPAAFGKIYTALAAVAGTAASLVAWIGPGAATPATSDSTTKGWKARLILPAAGVLFLVSLLVLLSLALDRIVPRTTTKATVVTFFNSPVAFSEAWMLVLAAVFAAIPMVLGLAINVNRFSLHSVYRNRLIRAFLGASTEWFKRKDDPNRFTGFRDSDNIEMQRLWDRREISPGGLGPLTGKDWRPFHVINIALNVVSGRNPALQDRKALPFVATPLWCGAAALDGGRGAFRRSSEFGGEEKTITVGTAMAISGAAISPNMGYHSSPLISFLLTLFNVRLGWWYGNPVDGETYRLEGPRWAIKSLAYEALGLTDERRPYIYLSDGGHFDNLGLYEMVRRRCRTIVVVDAGSDATCSFEDLANSCSRVKMDFGISIDIDLECVRQRNRNRLCPNDGGSGFAVGRICYKAIDGPGSDDGKIVYIKPTFRGDEPASVLGYAAKFEDFPHESTLNQWFSEAQFESYRALGYAIAKRTGLKPC